MNDATYAEQALVRLMLKNGYIPYPDKGDWSLIRAKYNFPDFEKVDEWFCKLDFPKG